MDPQIPCFGYPVSHSSRVLLSSPEVRRGRLQDNISVLNPPNPRITNKLIEIPMATITAWDVRDAVFLACLRSQVNRIPAATLRVPTLGIVLLARKDTIPEGV